MIITTEHGKKVLLGKGTPVRVQTVIMKGSDGDTYPAIMFFPLEGEEAEVVLSFHSKESLDKLQNLIGIISDNEQSYSW